MNRVFRFILLGLIGVGVVACQKKKARHEAQFGGPTMGTSWNLRVVGDDLPKDVQAVVQRHLDAREAVLSHWRKDSAVSRFNDSASTEWIDVPEELVRVVQLAKGIADQTDGVLDITLAPIIDLWGFGAHRTDSVAGERRVPKAAEIAAARQACGWSHLQWRMEPPGLRKDLAGLRINVSAVTEGFVADELVVMLPQRGVRDFLLNLGGEIAARGRSAEGVAWNVGIQTPNAPQGEAMEAVPLSDLCLATSGVYRQYFEAEGNVYPHLLDPRTGRPVTHGLQSVSVIHPSCALADGFATALMVLGPEQGRAVADRLGLRVVWVE